MSSPLSPPGPSSLTRRTAAGLGWSWAGVAATAVLQLVNAVVMSRLLAPSDFGLLAASLLGLQVVTYVSRFGLGSAVVQRSVLGPDGQAVAFTLSSILGLLTALVAIVTAPLLASLVHDTRVTSVIRWLAVGVLLGALATVPDALLRRELRFRALGVIQVTSYALAYLGLGVPLAVRGWGVWSLVAANVGQSVLQFFLTTYVSGVRLAFRFDRSEARRLIGFGGAVAATGFLEFLGSTLDNFAVARWIGSSALGQYSRATYLVGAPIEQVSTATTRVLLPSFAAVQDEPARFRRALVATIGLLSLLVIPPVAIAAAGAPVFVRLMLGKVWIQAASILPIVGSAYALTTLTHLPAVAAEAKGLVGVKFRIQVASLAVFLVGVTLAAVSGATLKLLAGAWLVSEVARLSLYVVFIVPAIHATRVEVLCRYGVAAVVAVIAASPVVVQVRLLDVASVPAVFGGLVAGLGMSAAFLLTPLGRTVRADLETLRQGVRLRGDAK